MLFALVVPVSDLGVSAKFAVIQSELLFILRPVASGS